MNIPELLRKCAEIMESGAMGYNPGLVFHWPHGKGRFPFHGKGTELLSANDSGKNYFVSVKKVLTGIGESL